MKNCKNRWMNFRQKNTTLSQDQEELDRLRALYSLDTDYSEYDKVAAQVIGKDTGNWYSTFLINRGSSEALRWI